MTKTFDKMESERSLNRLCEAIEANFEARTGDQVSDSQVDGKRRFRLRRRRADGKIIATREADLTDALTEDMYKHCLALADCSYVEAHLFNHRNDNDDKAVAIKQWAKAVRDSHALKLPHLFPYHIIDGKTGNNNQTDDKTCVVWRSEDGAYIIVAFHGSASKDFRDFFDDEGDWGSNFDTDPTKTCKDLFPPEQSGIPCYVGFHGGYLGNYSSAHDNLIATLETLLAMPSDYPLRDRWVIVTGHSKGGGMAVVAAPIVKSYLMKSTANEQLAKVKVGVVAFSAPRVVHGDDSQAWVQETLGKVKDGLSHNIIRIHVDADIVPKFPTERRSGYRHVGVSVIEDTKTVLRRMEDVYNKDVTALWRLFDINRWAPAHYSHGFRYADVMGTEDTAMFDPHVVIPFSLLQEDAAGRCCLI